MFACIKYNVTKVGDLYVSNNVYWTTSRILFTNRYWNGDESTVTDEKLRFRLVGSAPHLVLLPEENTKYFSVIDEEYLDNKFMHVLVKNYLRTMFTAEV